jgi:hypothetical protein
MQFHDGQWRLIQYGSRFLQDAESRYAIVELKALAIYWAIRKCKVYLAGLKHFAVVTDHKPFRTIFHDQLLDAVENPRILNYRSCLSSFKFSVEWKRGKDHSIPDALSRAPVSPPDDEEENDDESISPGLRVALVNASKIDLALENISRHAREDELYQELKSSVLNNTVGNIRSG